MTAHPEPTPDADSEPPDLALIQRARQQAEERTGETTLPWPGLGDGSSVNTRLGSPGCLSVPTEFGSVRLIREIGRGAMGVVYLARDRMLNRDVAVKFLLGAVSGEDDPDFQRFLEGARAAATVRHPNLTMVHQADLVEHIPYLVMEYVDGPTLAQILRCGGPLSVGAVVAALEAVAGALDTLHGRGIVHRDVKPSNVLLDADGGVYVTDFGLACVRGGRAPTGDATRAPLDLAGTPAYMAPEMFDGELSPRTDIYALGITAYELLAGVLPFRGSLDAVMRQHRSETLPREPLEQGDIAPGVIEVLERATRKEARFRYKTPENFVRALRSSSSSDDVSYGRTELSQRISDWRAEPVAAVQPADGASTSAYYDQLAGLAAGRRQDRGQLCNESPVSITPDVVPGSVADVLSVRITCGRCGYDLFGLPREGACPECGASMSENLRPDRLVFANPAWLSRIRGGLLLGYGSLVALLMTMPISITLSSPVALRELEIPAWLIVFALACAAMVGVRRATTPEPPGLVRQRRFSARAVASIAAALLIASSGVSPFVGGAYRRTIDRERHALDEMPRLSFETGRDFDRELRGHYRLMQVHQDRWQAYLDRRAQLRIVSVSLCLTAYAAGLLALGALMVYTIRLLRRIPDHGLVKLARLLLWFAVLYPPFSLVLLGIEGVLPLRFEPRLRARIFDWASALTGAVFVVGVVGMISLVVLVKRALGALIAAHVEHSALNGNSPTNAVARPDARGSETPQAPGTSFAGR